MTNQSVVPALSSEGYAPPEITDLIAEIEGDAALSRVLSEVHRRMDADPAHDIAHLLRVARWTASLADSSVDRRLAIAAALLHDVVNVPKASPERPKASLHSAAVARELLSSLGFPDADVELAAGAIRDHSYTRGAIPESGLGRALQDADRLDALGVIGTFRCVAMGVRLGAVFVHPSDPWAEERALDDGRYSVDHFFTKLLKLPTTFQTVAGRLEAGRRAAIMRRLLAELGRELGVDAPWTEAASDVTPAESSS
jgi:uncharacterized protein